MTLASLLGVGFSIPDVAVVAVGLVLSIVNLKRIRPAGPFALLGFGLMLVSVLLGVGTTLVVTFAASNMSYGSVTGIITVLNLVRVPFEVVGWVMILLALFKRREPVADAPGQPSRFAQPGPAAQPGQQYGQPGQQYGQPGQQYGQPGQQYGQIPEQSGQPSESNPFGQRH